MGVIHLWVDVSRGPFPDGTREDLAAYRDVTDEVVAKLIGAGFVVDEGRMVLDVDDPDIYIRQLRLRGWQAV